MRTMADCCRWPSDSNYSLTIIGEQDEVIRAAAEHAASVHGHQDTPQLREQLRRFLEPAQAYSSESRAARRSKQSPRERRWSRSSVERRVRPPCACKPRRPGSDLDAPAPPAFLTGPRGEVEGPQARHVDRQCTKRTSGATRVEHAAIQASSGRLAAQMRRLAWAIARRRVRRRAQRARGGARPESLARYCGRANARRARPALRRSLRRSWPTHGRVVCLRPAVRQRSGAWTDSSSHPPNL